MCGIAGIVSPNPENIKPAVLQQMADALAHRGPDGEGFWQNKYNNCGFAHRRLSILDLTNASAQPLHYLQRFTIVYNGALYNYIELRNRLISLGYHFHSMGDTEVLVAAYAHFGAECLQHFEGMFAFAIWDEKEQLLFCARDRFGEKPFYYYKNEEALYFASEMKGLWAASVPRDHDESMMARYLALGYVQNPADASQTFFKNIFSLKAGEYGIFYLPESRWELKQYFSLNNIENKISDKDAIGITGSLLKHSVQMRMRSDVAIGSSLSGGLDSSSILFFMQQIKKDGADLTTYSACYPGFARDESTFINQVCEALKVKNEKVYPNAEDFLKDFEKLCYHQEEPFSSSSIYAQFMVYEAAGKNGTKVLLDGQGADELFAGYPKYIHWFLQEKIRKGKWGEVLEEIKKLRRNSYNFQWGMRNVAAAFLPAYTRIQLEKREHSKLLQPAFLNSDLISQLEVNIDGIYKPAVSRLNDILRYNVADFGLQELLRYADRNSMAHGVEVRQPFLSAELVKFALSLPYRHKIDNGYTKAVLRKAMAGKLPDGIVWRKDKIGFETPQKDWMQLSEMKERVIEAKQKMVTEKYLDKKVLRRNFEQVGVHDAGNEEWRILNAAQMLKK